MKATLISYTPHAVELLLFTKSTRLNMAPSLLNEIHEWSPKKKAAELDYMARTIPSSWEFVDYVFLLEGVSRAFTHQLVRTRHGSYAQQSLRVVDAGAFDYVHTARSRADETTAQTIEYAMGNVQAAYRKLRNCGLPTEDARGILPTNIATNIVAKFNLRTFAELARSRTGGRTQGEYQDVLNAMADAAVAVHPWLPLFLFPKGRDAFAEIEAFATRTFPDDLAKKGELLKIVDAMRKGES